MVEKITSKDVRLLLIEKWRAIWRNLWSDVGLLWLSFLVAMTGSLVIRDGNFSGLLNRGRLIMIFGFSITAALINYGVKEKERKKVQQDIESNLDIQYDMAFRYSSLSNFKFQETINNPEQTLPYIESLLFNISEIVRIILEANNIKANTITANLMIETHQTRSQRFLKIFAFGPSRPGRKKIKLPLTDVNPLPGAQTAFTENRIEYIDDITNPIYNGIFNSKEYKSFVSVPISENEDDGIRFAILNIDSPVENQFGSKVTFNAKIYPALKPSIALIKVLHKIGRI